MIESVKKLRSRINDADSPVLYKWWFKYDGKLFDIFVEHKVDKEKLEKCYNSLKSDFSNVLVFPVSAGI